MSGTPVSLPILVLHGREAGPTVWMTAAIHGDELCGVEIIRRVLERVRPETMSGTIVAVPVVNVHGFNAGTRYLPDRRDLNRSFPGSLRGSLASRIAKLLMTEVIARCDVGMDFHTGSDQRENLPQIRADLDDPMTATLAKVFAPPVAIHSRVRDGSLRQAATDVGSTVLLYEGGEASRFSARAIRAGSEGALRVLSHLGVFPGTFPPAPPVLISRSSSWIRATRSGILHLHSDLGDHVAQGDTIATIHDPYGQRLGSVKTRKSGLIVGSTHSPLVNRGDAIVHIAEITNE
ncbi:MAG: succinylglutamate desuccinylase [Armatimonadetes bacterium]|nr:MAG: succinylglutamate desuccinylase [Armatimonadota bacterium]